MTDWLYARIADGIVHPTWTPEHPAPKDGSRVLVQVRTPRNIRHHRKYWGILRTAVDATGRWESIDQAHRDIKLAVGHYVRHPQPDGTVLAELLPTDFAAMSQAKFRDYYGRAMAVIAIETGVDPEILERESGR